MAFGTYAGGWRISAPSGSALRNSTLRAASPPRRPAPALLWVTQYYGFPVSTTHTISGAVLGGAATSRLSAVRWGVAGNIVIAWLITIPCAALVGGVMELVTRVEGGDLIVFILVGVIAFGAFAARRWETRRLLPPEALESAPI